MLKLPLAEMQSYHVREFNSEMQLQAVESLIGYLKVIPRKMTS